MMVPLVTFAATVLACSLGAFLVGWLVAYRYGYWRGCNDGRLERDALWARGRKS